MNDIPDSKLTINNLSPTATLQELLELYATKTKPMTTKQQASPSPKNPP